MIPDVIGAIAFDDLQLFVIVRQGEVAAGDADHLRVDLHHALMNVRQMIMNESGNGSTTQADAEHGCGFRRKQQEHHDTARIT